MYRKPLAVTPFKHLAYIRQMEMHSDDDFTMAFDYASGATTERFQNPLWYVTDVLFGARLRKSISIVKAFGQKIVASAVADRKAGKFSVVKTNNGQVWPADGHE